MCILFNSCNLTFLFPELWLLQNFPVATTNDIFSTFVLVLIILYFYLTVALVDRSSLFKVANYK